MKARPSFITLKCPSCKRRLRVRRLHYDAPDAGMLSLKCDRCDNGGGFNESEPVKPKLPAMAKVLAMFRQAPKVTRKDELKLAKAVRSALAIRRLPKRRTSK